MSIRIDEYQSESINPETVNIDTAETIEVMRMINNEDFKNTRSNQNGTRQYSIYSGQCS